MYKYNLYYKKKGSKTTGCMVMVISNRGEGKVALGCMVWLLATRVKEKLPSGAWSGVLATQFSNELQVNVSWNDTNTIVVVCRCEC